MNSYLKTYLYIPECRHTIQSLGGINAQQQNPRKVEHLPRRCWKTGQIPPLNKNPRLDTRQNAYHKHLW